MGLRLKALAKSPWVFHVSAGSCNNCDIEILDCLCPRFDIERFGAVLVGSVRHADALLVTGAMNRKSAVRVKKLYEQAAKPCLVIAVGSCARGGLRARMSAEAGGHHHGRGQGPPEPARQSR